MRTSARIAVAAMIGMSAFATGASGETWTIQLQEQQLGYPVLGSSAGELRRALERHAPHEGHGHTRLDVSLDYDLVPGEEGCTAERRLIRARITVSLPEWSPHRDAPADLVDEWERARAILRRHEEGHRALLLDGVGQLRDLLGGFGPRSDCRQLRNAINALLTREMTKLGYRNQRFDMRTRGGLRDDPLQTAVP